MATFEDLRANYALDFTWDVRNHVPPHQNDQGDIDRRRTDDEEQERDIQEVYNRINMMTFLLEGIPFDVFLGKPISNWIDDVIYKVAHQGRWPGRVAPNGVPNDDDPYRRASQRKEHAYHPDFPNNGPSDHHESDLRRFIHTQLTAVKNSASGSPAVLLRTFWETAYADLDQKHQNVYDEFKTLHDTHPHRHRFCMPFLTVQDQNPPALVPPDIMSFFIKSMKGVTHYDVFTKSVKYFPEIREAIDLGKRHYIFEGPPSHDDKFNSRGGGGPNNRICYAPLSTCITNETTSCTADANGYCTSG